MNYAHRVLENAAGDEILVSRAVVEAMRGDCPFLFDLKGMRVLKGAGEDALYTVVGVHDAMLEAWMQKQMPEYDLWKQKHWPELIRRAEDVMTIDVAQDMRRRLGFEEERGQE